MLPADPVLPRVSVVDACADHLRAAILSGQLAPGERLPPERQLAEQLGVNRVTLRSALARLASESLLAVRQGSAHIVRDFRHSGGPGLIGNLFDAAKTTEDVAAIAEDVLLVRRSLARVVVSRLAGASKAALAPVHEAIAAFGKRVAEPDVTVEQVAAADLMIVRAMLDATGRPALQLFWNPVLAVLAGASALRKAMYADPAANARGWLALGAWLTSPQKERQSKQHVDDAMMLLDRLLLERDQIVLRQLLKNEGGR